MSLITRFEARRGRGTAQLLDAGNRRHPRSVPDAVSHLIGVQAQDERAMGLSLLARTPAATETDLYGALADRSLVITWSFRGTRHLHHRDDADWIRALYAPRLLRPSRRQEQLGIAGSVGERATAELVRVLARDGPLDRNEVKAVLGAVGVDPSGQAPIHVIRQAVVAGDACIIPSPGGPERYGPVDEGSRSELDREVALAELGRRYLRAYGPATATDFASWSGLGPKLARTVWALLADEIEEVAWPPDGQDTDRATDVEGGHVLHADHHSAGARYRSASWVPSTHFSWPTPIAGCTCRPLEPDW